MTISIEGNFGKQGFEMSDAAAMQIAWRMQIRKNLWQRMSRKRIP